MPRQRAHVDDSEHSEQSDEMVASIKFGMNSIKQLIKDLGTLGSSAEQRDENVERLTTKYKLLIKALIVHHKSAEIVDEVAKELDIDREDASEAEIVAACERIATLSKQKVDDYAESISDEDDIISHHAYAELISVTTQILGTNNEDDEEEDSDADSEATEPMDVEENDDEEEDEESGEDVEGTSTPAIPTIDPVTKKPLTDPVININCKHIYGKAAIMALITAKKTVRCPTVGCNNTKAIRAKDLVEDAKITKAVKELLAKSKGKGKRRGR